MLISTYRNGFDIQSIVTEDISAILSGIKTGRWQDECLPIMNEPDEKKRRELKKHLPNYTISGRFDKGRADKTLIEHSNLIGIDFDHVDNINGLVNQLKSDPYTFAVFKSVSHTGVCAIVKIEGSKHLESFNGLAQYYWDKFRVKIDTACKNVSRIRYVSFDPDLYINEKSKVFKNKVQEIEKKNDEGIPHSDTRFGFVLKNIEKAKKDITGNYVTWVRLGFAIAHQYGKHGVEFFKAISKYSEQYTDQECEEQYELCCRNSEGREKVATIKAFYNEALHHDIDIYTEDEKIMMKVAEVAKLTGLTVEQAKKMIEDEGVIPDDAIVTKGYEQAKKEEKKSNKLDIEAVKLFLRRYQIKKNEVTRKYEWNGNEMNTEDFNTIFLEAKEKFEKLSNDMFLSIIFSHFTPTYNPIKAYFDSIDWDGEDRIKPLVQSINSDTGDFDYRLIAVQSWLLGIIESIYIDNPNILQLIFAGKQNTGKSVFFKQLLPKQLSRYFGLSQLDNGKDDQILMCEKLLILDDEYSGKAKEDAKLIKRLLSAPHFDIREPYGRQNVKMKRIASLCATTNETKILNDITGNRRILVLEVIGKFDYVLYNSIDKEQLFGQLYDMHKKGYEAQLTDKMIDLMKEYTHSRNSEPSVEEECLEKLFNNPTIHDGYSYLTNTEIVSIIMDKMKLRVGSKKLGIVLKELGYEQKKKNGVQKYQIMPK
jgi:hypothetical protein